MTTRNDDQGNGRGKRKNRLRNIIIAIAVIFLFAYAVQVTQINLEEPLEPRRQANLVGLIRELARPALFEYESVTRSIDLFVRMPCPEQLTGSRMSSEGRELLLAPNCATTTQDPLTLSGEGFPADARGQVRWYPAGATTLRTVAEFRADDDGNFSVTFTMPDVRETEEPQRLEVVELIESRIVGPSPTTLETLNRMLETVLMALMASTIGTILAVPISFLGARNLMENVGTPLAAIMAAVIALPIGWFIGAQIGGWLSAGAGEFTSSGLLGVVLLVVVVGAAVALALYVPIRGESASARLLGTLRLLMVIVLGFLALGIAARLGLMAGRWLDANLGLFSFVGNFIYVVADFVWVFLPTMVALVGALFAASYASRFGQEAVLGMDDRPAQLLTAVLTALGTAIFFFSLFYALNWICLLGVCEVLPQETLPLLSTLALPALILGAIAGLLSLRVRAKWQAPIGMATYTVTRTTLNVLRSIEPVIMGFVLVVWVGIGPFAGVLALMLHSIADLGKLFSEQVENIEEGPVEAVTATGANRLQTITYAVVPQIVPHYTAFIFYRWDINVRMSTIIGFVGGGGIGLLLFRSTNLTQYRQAAVMVIAIAVVVTALDYVSSKIRSRII